MNPIEAVDELLLQLPLWAVASALAVLGAIWGSFASALCVRWPKGESVAKGRSHCDHCGATLGIAELVPIFSYLFLKGRCRRCGGAIGPMAIRIELACAICGAASALLLPGASALAAAIFLWLLLPLALLDWRYLWLPDWLLAALAASGLLFGQWLSDFGLADHIIGGVGGYLLFELLRIGFARLRGVEGMGKGDPKLLGAIGLWLGWQMLPIIILLASAIGLSHYFIAARGGRARDLLLPLGSYLAIAAGLLPFAVAMATSFRG